jgi:2-oxoisovalerate dehydrogenase E1 component
MPGKIYIYPMKLPDIPRYPARLSEAEFYSVAYRYIYCARILDLRLTELFNKGYVKGTVVMSMGQEASSVGMTMPFRPGFDVLAMAHRNLSGHIVHGMPLKTIICQYMANAESPTHGREGNIHFGDISARRMPFLSHLGAMMAPGVGGTWAARRSGQDVLGLVVIGDGGSSTGDFHESLNLASVHKVPVLFVIENNHYAFSTPSEKQYACEKLSSRAAGYGINGITIDGTDPWLVYTTVLSALDSMHKTGMPFIIESDCPRLMGHAVYDKAEYVTDAQRAANWKRDPVPKSRARLMELSGMSEKEITAIEKEIELEIDKVIRASVDVARPDPSNPPMNVFAPFTRKTAEPFKALKVKNGTAVNKALDYLLQRHPEAVLLGQDIGPYGSAFKTCKGLHKKYGSERVMDMPVCESATIGFCLGASQTGSRPIMEFQFSDFSTDAVTQLGINSGTWYFRCGQPAPMLVRLPCGGGITLGAFHSGEYEGLWANFPGLKLLYPVTPQETFEALVAGFYDPNPVLVFEHKQMYWNREGDIDFDGNLENIYRPRQYREGNDLTVVAFGAMVEAACNALDTLGYTAEVWNPFILKPLEHGPIADSVKKTGRLLVIQESNQMAGVGNHIISRIAQTEFSSFKCCPRLLAPKETPVPFARELESEHIPETEQIIKAIMELMEIGH